MTTHTDIQLSLAEWLRARRPPLLVDAEIALAGSYGSHGRADVASIEWAHDRPVITVWECKATRADLGADLSAGKWQRYLDQCHRLVIATPTGVATRTDAPEGVGLATLSPKGTWRMVVRPQQRQMTDAAVMAAMSRLLRRGVYQRVAAEATESHDAAERRERRERWASMDDDMLVSMINGRVATEMRRLAAVERGQTAAMEAAAERLARREETLRATEHRIGEVPDLLDALSKVLHTASAAFRPSPRGGDNASAARLRAAASAATPHYSQPGLEVFS